MAGARTVLHTTVAAIASTTATLLSDSRVSLQIEGSTSFWRAIYSLKTSQLPKHVTRNKPFTRLHIFAPRLCGKKFEIEFEPNLKRIWTEFEPNYVGQ